MAFGVLGATPDCNLEVDDPAVADVSFPGFWKLLERVQTPVSVEPAVRVEGPRSVPRCVVLAIDGSAGAGKSTTAAAAASRLGFDTWTRARSTAP